MNERILAFQAACDRGERIAVLTAYDYPMARLLERAACVFLDDKLLRLHLHPRADHRDELGDHELHEDACLRSVR